jgi:hypothetical protein
MDKMVFISNMQRLDKAYPPKIPLNKVQLQEKVNFWYEYFADCKEKIFEQAVTNYIKHEEFPPSIAGVMKYYREIETYLKEMKEFLFSQYSMMMATWDENLDQETLNEFVKVVRKYPGDKKKEAAIEITNRAISYHHDCEYDGRKAPSLLEYLRGER